MTDIVLLPGDGIGPEIVEAVTKILHAAGADLNYHTFEIGAGAYEKYGSLIPEETFKAIEKYKIALKGPVTTPIGKGFRSVNVQLRLKYNLYVNLRPAYSFEGISKYPNVDIVTVRENTEDLYIGEEKEIDGTRRAYCCQRIVSDTFADNDTVHHVVKLLEQVAEKHRKGKCEDQLRGTAFRHVYYIAALSRRHGIHLSQKHPNHSPRE